MREYFRMMIEKDKVFIFWIFLILFFLIFTKLENSILPQHDDITHACMGKMILKLNDWFTLHEGKDISFLKPPFYFWFEAVLFKIFGFTEYAARLPSAIMGFGTIILAYLLALTLYKSRRIAVTILMILSTSTYFLKYTKLAMLDMPVAFSTTLSLYFFSKYEFEKKKRFVYLFALSCGLGYYIKGVQGIYPLVIIPLYYILKGEVKKLFSKEMVISYLLFLGVVMFWFLPSWMKYKDLFLYSQSGIGPIIHRGLEGKSNPFYQPMLRLIGLNPPWGLVNLLGLCFALRIFREKDFNSQDKEVTLFVLLSFLTMILILSISNTFYIRYLIPTMVPFSILGGVMISYYLTDSRYFIFKKVTFILLFLLFVKNSVFPIKQIAKDSTPYHGLYQVLKYLPQIDRNEVVIYREKYYLLNQGLCYYTDILPKRYISTPQQLLETYNEKEIYLTNYKGFEELFEYIKPENIFLLATDNKNWAVFKIRGNN